MMRPIRMKNQCNELFFILNLRDYYTEILSPETNWSIFNIKDLTSKVRRLAEDSIDDRKVESFSDEWELQNGLDALNSWLDANKIEDK